MAVGEGELEAADEVCGPLPPPLPQCKLEAANEVCGTPTARVGGRDGEETSERMREEEMEKRHQRG